MSPALLKVSFSVATLFFSFGTLCADSTRPLYLDPAQPSDVRVADLVSRMTLEEKASMMRNSTPGVPRLGIPRYDWWSEALHGVANAGHATVFPQAIGLAAMWDEALHRDIARVIGAEARAKFNGYVGTENEGMIFRGLTFWSPNINIFRDPRWGRGQETYGEDPFLTSRLGVAFVRGLQGDNPDYLVAAACAKHFAVHSGPESLRHQFDASPSHADLYETYLPAFEALVREGHVEIVMTAYNSIYDTPCSINPLLYSLLGKWGFDGHVTSDCGSVADLSRTYKRAADDIEAEALTMRAGMNVRCGFEAAGLVAAVKTGKLSEAELDVRLHTLLRTLFRLGIFDPKEKVPFNKISPADNDTPEHGKLALQAAREAMVLLKNDGVLPIDVKKVKRVAVIGPNATSVPVLVGNYNGEPSAPVTVLDGLKAVFEPLGVKLDYVHGCEYSTRPATWRLIPHPWFRGDYFANRELSGEPAAKRTERPLCFDCIGSSATGLPPGVPDKNVSIRWNGELQTTMPGKYQFMIRGRGGFRLMVAGKTVIDAWATEKNENVEVREVTGSCELPENASVPIRLEYVQGEGAINVALHWTTPPYDTQEGEAIAAAKAADLVVFVGGITAQLEGEEMVVDYDGFPGGDRQRIELPTLQRKLLEKVQAVGKPVVYVNMSGSAVALPWEDEHLNAILQAWYPGQAGGRAVADVLAGNYNPSGRLPITFYRATEDLPDFKNYDMANRTYRYFGGKPLYPFGHGLSYTTFKYSKLQAKALGNGLVEVSLEVRNTGGRDGDEVVQLYAIPPAESHPRERQALCGFSRVHLTKGEAKTVTIRVPATATRRWNDGKGDYEIPSGLWTIRAGASSNDIREQINVKL
jgi:beta-glucosidase